jgi:cilia- and flagella-associated protein 298
MLIEKQLKDYVGVNEKTKVVVKLVKSGEGPPVREQVITEEVRKQLMLQSYRRQEEIKVSDD